MKRIVLIVAISLAALLASGCAGTPFEWTDARKIKSGMSIDEVTHLVGSPNTVRAQGDTLRYVWVWVNLYSGTRTLVVDFKDGKVIQAPPIPDSFQ